MHKKKKRRENLSGSLFLLLPPSLMHAQQAEGKRTGKKGGGTGKNKQGGTGKRAHESTRQGRTHGCKTVFSCQAGCFFWVQLLVDMWKVTSQFVDSHGHALQGITPPSHRKWSLYPIEPSHPQRLTSRAFCSSLSADCLAFSAQALEE